MASLDGHAFRQRQSHAPVTREIVGAGQHEVAHTGQAHEGLFTGAKRDAKARHFDETPIYQRDPRVGTETQAIRHAGTDGKDVLDGTPHFDTDHVIRRVRAKLVARQSDGQGLREFIIVGCDSQGGWQSCGNLLGKRWPGQHGHWTIRAKHFGSYLVRQFSGVQLKTLGCPAHAGSRPEEWLDCGERVAQAVAGYGDEDIACTLKALLELRVCNQVRGEAGAGKVASIFTRGRHGRQLIQLEQAPQPDIATAARKLQGQRGTPGTGANYGNRLWRVALNQCFSASSAAAATCCCFDCMYRASKFMGCKTNSGKPPFCTNEAMDSRANGNRMFGQ